MTLLDSTITEQTRRRRSATPLRQGQGEPDDLAVRARLEARYASRIREHLELRWLASNTQNMKAPFCRWFKYKEAFSYDFPRMVLSRLDLRKGATVLDPFCGTGTVLLSARDLGYRGRGFDLLPLAVFVSQVKLRQADEYDLDDLDKAAARICSIKVRKTRSTFPDITILPKAYDADTANAMLFLRDVILAESNTATRELLLLGLLATMEEVSHTVKDGLGIKLKRKSTILPVQEVLARRLAMMISDLHNGHTLFSTRMPASASLGDARRLPLRKSSISAVITSPPYLNRYDYARIYSIELALNFVGSFEELRALRHRLLRGYIEAKPADTNNVNWGVLPAVLERVSQKPLNNKNIPTMIRAYFEDMYVAIHEMARVCKPGAKVAMLIGNSRFAGEVVPVDLMLCEIAERHGFDTEEIWALHYKGNASQQMGRYGQHRVRESILFWQRRS